MPCIVSLCHSVLSLPCLTDETIVTYCLWPSALLFFRVSTYESVMLKISWRSRKRVHVPIVIIYTKWTGLVFVNETTPQISCLLCFSVVGLNCFERKYEYEVTFDIWRNTKIISVCLVFQPADYFQPTAIQFAALPLFTMYICCTGSPCSCVIIVWT